MNIYHPDVDYTYFAEKKDVKRILKKARLISPDIYKEEDVIIGKYKGAKFYLSEIKLEKRSKNSSYTIFKGILFNIKMPGKSFPHSQIQSKPGLLRRIFNGFTKNEEFGFWYETKNPKKFNDQMKSLFPFVKYLMDKQGDIRINTDGDEMTVMVKSDMKFLDDPKPRLSQTFLKPEYYENMGKQINSLLFIIESFANNLSSSEITERLELKALEYVREHRKHDAHDT